MKDSEPRRRVGKVLAYVTSGHELLVFTHRDFPEAGLQVPAGTIKAKETPRNAVIREVFEETGINDVVIQRLIARYEIDMRPYKKDEIHDRYVFHLQVVKKPASGRWIHYELHDGKGKPTAFSLFWIDIFNRDAELAAGQGDWLWRLEELLKSSQV